MSITCFFIIRLNNFKGNLFNLGKKDKINNLKTDIIMNNIVKIKKNDDFNFLNNKCDPRRGNKRKRKFYNKKTIIRVGKYGSLNQINIIKRKKSLNFNFFNY